MPVCNRIGRASLYTVTTKNAARIVDVVYRSVAFAGRNSIRIGVFSGFDINTIGRTGRGAKETADTLFQSIFVAVQHVNAAIARLKVHRLFRITFRGGFPEHRAEGHTKTAEHGPECVIHFANWRRHARSLSNAEKWGKPAPTTPPARAFQTAQRQSVYHGSARFR